MKGYSFRSLTDLVLKIFKTKVNAGTGLSGGGSLEADRTLTVKYGTDAGTAAQGNDGRLSNSREWTGATISQAEAEEGIATTRRAFTAQRVRQAIVAWFNGISGSIGRTILGRDTATQVRSDLQLGTASLKNHGLKKGDVALSGDIVYLDGVDNVYDRGGLNCRWGFSPPTFLDSRDGYTPSYTAGYGLLLDAASNGVLIAVDSNTGRLYSNGRGGNRWRQERNYIATVDVTNSVGQSTSYPMSQAATTNQLATKVDTSTQVIAGTGLTGGGTLVANRTLAVTYGTSAGTAAQGDDSRIVGAAQKTYVDTELNKKEDKVTGKGLSTNDYTNVDKTIVDTSMRWGGSISTSWDDLARNAVFPTYHQVSGTLPNDAPEGAHTFGVLTCVPSNIVAGGKWVRLTYTPHTNIVNGRVVYIKVWSTSAETGEWIKLEPTKVLSTIGASADYPMSQKATTDLLATKANTSTQMIAGTGLEGGGNLTANRTLSIAASHIPIGVGQSWQNVTSSRSIDTIYTNTTGRTIEVTIQAYSGNSRSIYVDNASIATTRNAGVNSNIDSSISATVPSGSTYIVKDSHLNVGVNYTRWMELR